MSSVVAPESHTTDTASLYSGKAGAHWLPGAPVAPRVGGIAAVASGRRPPSTAAAPTVVRLLAKDAAAAAGAAASPSPLAAVDAKLESVVVAYEGERRVLSCSLGAPLDKADLASVRRAVVAAVARLRALKVTGGVSFVVPRLSGEGAPSLAAVAACVTQAACLANYGFDKYLSGEDKVPAFLASIHVAFGEGEGAAEAETEAEAAAVAAVQQAAVLCDCTIFARDLVNERADEMHPQRLEELAQAVAAETGASLFVLKGEALVDEGLHLLAAVGQCARHAPRYLELLYKGDPESYRADGSGDVVMVVGKGITFDTGGLNIKGTGNMEEMHMDMGGASVALSTALACHRLGLKRNVIFVAAVAENAIGSRAYKPKNIIRSHKGLTVEIGNTDAEGRLVLADALSFGQSRHRPHTVVDLATLTGACVVGLGEYAAGLFSNNEALRAGLLDAGAARFERLHAMPIFPEHREELRASTMSDLQSTGAGRYGGACTAAAFLEHFIGHEPAKNARVGTGAADGADKAAAVVPAWAHLDIAGPATYSKARGHMNAGGTGFGVQVVAHYLLHAPAGAPAANAVKRS